MCSSDAESVCVAASAQSFMEFHAPTTRDASIMAANVAAVGELVCKKAELNAMHFNLSGEIVSREVEDLNGVSGVLRFEKVTEEVEGEGVR